ncbi:MAG: tRNA dihydrouridine synthase DusB [Bacillota bacterium]|nr:tRNA dihydrouridine synthase DusB [Bacillota bacterium]
MERNKISIGGVLVSRDKALLAPMAGVADLAFRKICKDHSAGMTCSEMVSAKALALGSRKSENILEKHPAESPFAVQIFGSDPGTMAEGAEIAVSISGADILDINMGCPTPKIVSNGDGSALMKNPDLASTIIRAAVGRVKVPVTVKFRLGWDKSSVNAVEFARMAEASGASAICVHGRTREQQYSGKADWNEIAKVKNAVKIPVTANGDIFSPSDALEILKITGADLIMAGRGALGNPWLFDRIYAALASKPEPGIITLEERLKTAEEQIRLTSLYKGERIALLEARKHFMWYLKGVKGAKIFFEAINRLETLDGMEELKNEIIQWGCGVTE